MNQQKQKRKMESYGNPTKKMRFDDFSDSDVGIGLNDDLWGQDDLTAEEFDMLEIQATQSCQQKDTNQHVLKSANNASGQYNLCNGVTLPNLEEIQQQQYALEGKVKLLTYSLEKTAKELKEERLNREAIIGQRIDTFQKNEGELKKEIEKAKSVLQFKEQEMKSFHDKVRSLEIQLKQNKDNNTERMCDTSESSPNKFLKRFAFDDRNQHKTAEAVTQTKETSSFCRKYKLNLNVPQGESSCVDLVSSVLCNRISSPPSASLLSSITPLTHPTDISLKLSQNPSPAMSLARLNAENNTEDLWQSYESLLKEHLAFLKQISSVAKSSISTVGSTNSVTSPVSARLYELKSKQFTVLACLKDLSSLLSCRQLDPLVEVSNSSTTVTTENDLMSQLNNDVELDNYSCPLFFAEDEKMETSSVSTHPLLKLLVTLAHPKTYPQGYENKNEEIEWCLASIAAWSSTSKNKMVHCIYELPLCELISGQHGTMCIYLVLKLLIEFSASCQFDAILIHKNEDCLLCRVAHLCHQTIGNAPEEHINLMMMVENLFSIILAEHVNSRVKLESAPCISKVLQSLISILWKLYQLSDKNAAIFLALKKGLVLLLQFSTHIQDFKGKRFSVEDQYISLVSGFLSLSKENLEFKEFYDDIHELWDFQEDTTEFDLEETGDELSESIAHDNCE